MTTHDWLARLLARPLADPLDWESYSVTMTEATWSALSAEIEAGEGYADGLELGLRLLQAAWHHRERLGPRTYVSHQMRLYRSILEMLDKAERWDTYLRVWDAILARTDLYLNLRGDAADGNPALAACIRRPAGAATPPRPFAPRPERIEVHFLHRQIGRRAAIARRLAQGEDGKAAPGRLLGPPRRSAPPALSTTEIEGRLFRAAAGAGEG